MVSKIALNHWRRPLKGIRALRRKDWLGPVRFPNHPFYLDPKMRVHGQAGDNRLLILPLPAANRFSPAIWYTIGFMLGWNVVQEAVKNLGSKHEGFYYMMHPSDFLANMTSTKTFQYLWLGWMFL